MAKEPRKPIPRDIEVKVLDQSRRRCGLCFQSRRMPVPLVMIRIVQLVKADLS
jgi:hypothetical protein